MKLATYYVYHVTVTEPDCESGVVRYVGKGTGKRSQAHAMEARRLNDRRVRGVKVGRKSRWENYLAKALREGRAVRDVVVITGLTHEIACYIERLHIASFRANHPGQIKNTLAGGDGFSSKDAKALWADPTHSEKMKVLSKDPKRRQAHSERMKELHKDPERRRTHSERMKALNKDPAYRRANSERMRELNKDPGRRQTYGKKIKALHENPAYHQAHGERMRALNRDPKRRRAHSEKMRELWTDPERRQVYGKKKTWSPAQRQAASERAKEQWNGKAKSPEHRAKISAGLRAYRQRQGAAPPADGPPAMLDA